MNLTELKAAGGIVEAAPVKKKIEWKNAQGEMVNFDIYVRRLAFGPLERLMLSDDDERSRSASYLSATILLGEKADEPLPYDAAYQLDPSLAAAFLNAAREVNGTGETSAKN